RQLLNFDQANSIAEFQAVRDRVQSHEYRPTEADVTAARAAFLKLDTALTTDTTADATRVIAPPGGTSSGGAPSSASGPIRTGTPPVPDADPVRVVSPPRRFPLWMWITAAVVVVAAVVLIILRPFGGGTSALQEGVDAYRRGQREAAVNAFNRAVRDDKN